MAAKGLFINSTEQGFTVRGVNNNFFPDNATLAYPANSVILITDESDMATFRSASNYDVLFSALIKDININGERVTKDNIIETFNEAANKPSGGGGNPDAFTSVEYDGKSELKFYNDKGVEVANVDVTPFIKDGMVEDVEISEGNLVIHFNTDSDIKDIYIPLTDIFDPEAYYTKQEIDSQVNDIRDTIDEKEEVISTALNALNEDVENLSDDKADTSALTAHTGDADVHFTDGQKSKYDGLEGQYYNEDHWDIMPQSAFEDFSGDYSTAMGQFDQRITANANAITTKANASDVYTKTEADNKFLTEHQSLDNYYTKDDVYNKTESDAKYATQVVVNEEIAARIQAIRGVNTALEGKADKSDTYTKAQVDTALASKANSADLATVATSGSYNDLSDKPVIPDTTNLATKSELNAKQDALVSGTNIKTINGESLLGEGNIEIQGGGGEQQQADWNQTDTTAVDYIKNKPTNVSAFANDAGYLTQHQSLADYYTKSESDNKFALKFTDVDDIQMVSALPSNPDSRTLYLIPVE